AERAGEANAVPDGQNPASGVHWRWPLLALAVSVLVAPATISVLRRRLRLRTGQPEALWQELINTARDAGHRASSGLTPRQFAASLGGLPEPEQRTLDELVAAVEAERYGPDGFPHRLDRHAAATMLESVRRTASRPVRGRGRLLLPSVFVSSCRLTCSYLPAGTSGGGAVPLQIVEQPSSSRPCGVCHTDKSGPAGTMAVGLISV